MSAFRKLLSRAKVQRLGYLYCSGAVRVRIVVGYVVGFDCTIVGYIYWCPWSLSRPLRRTYLR